MPSFSDLLILLARFFMYYGLPVTMSWLYCRTAYVWCVMLLTFVKLIIALLDTEVKIIVVLWRASFSVTVARLRVVC